MAEQLQADPRPFSLVQGGIFYRFEKRVGLVRATPPDPAFRMWTSVFVTFLPLVVLAAVQGVLFGRNVTLPLLLDLTAYARFVIAIPLLLKSERNIDGRLADAVGHLRTSDLVRGEARGELEAVISRVERARDSVIPESLMLVGALVLGWVNAHAILGLPVSSWRQVTPGLISSTTLAGHWLDFVSMPIFNFLIYRWLWRIGLWTFFLWRVSRIDINLVPTHPDGAGGLGFLGQIHAVFGAFLAPLAASIAARGVQWVQYGEGTLESFRNAVIALAITLGPLLVFTPKLLAAKRRGLLEYGGFADEYTHGFDRKWLRGGRGDESPLGSGDIQSLADLGNSYGVIRSMRLVPAGLPQALTLVAAIALPMVPFLAFIMPLKEILKLLMQLVGR